MSATSANYLLGHTDRERLDAGALGISRARADDAGLTNVRFVQAKVMEYSAPEPYDAVVGRHILIHTPDGPPGRYRSPERRVDQDGWLYLRTDRGRYLGAQSLDPPIAATHSAYGRIEEL